jgi:hypothetical protein
MKHDEQRAGELTERGVMWSARAQDEMVSFEPVRRAA